VEVHDRGAGWQLGFVGKCYVVHESKVKTIVRGVKCSAVR
jgi:hypothetical protein